MEYESAGSACVCVERVGRPGFIDETTVYSQLLGLGMQKAQLYRLILERSRKDGLTDLYLRRIFMERLNEEISFSKRYGTSFSILMMDLDHFKNVNDSYGHPAGDAVLRSVAAALKSALHPGVMICRYGGEEFAAIIGLAPRDEVVAIAENVRRVVSVQVPGPNGVSINVTVSVRVALFADSPPVGNGPQSRRRSTPPRSRQKLYKGMARKE